MLASDHAERVVINAERVKYWLSVGAQPTDRVTLFLSRAGLIEAQVRRELTKKCKPKKKAQEKLKKEAEAAAQAA